MPHRCRRRGEFAPRSCCRCYGLTTRVSHRLSAMPRSRGVEVVPVSGGFCVDGTHLPDSVVQRSGLLLELCASCTGSATIPIRKETFRLWSRYAHGSAPWDDLVKIMEVRPENQLTGRRCVPVCSRHLDGSAHYARLLRKWCYARFFLYRLHPFFKIRVQPKQQPSSVPRKSAQPCGRPTEEPEQTKSPSSRSFGLIVCLAMKRSGTWSATNC